MYNRIMSYGVKVMSGDIFAPTEILDKLFYEYNYDIERVIKFITKHFPVSEVQAYELLEMMDYICIN